MGPILRCMPGKYLQAQVKLHRIEVILLLILAACFVVIGGRVLGLEARMSALEPAGGMVGDDDTDDDTDGAAPGPDFTYDED